MNNHAVENMLLSVIMPAFNNEAYIREAIDSVIAQSYTNIELIVIDDGSTDATLSIARSYGGIVHCFTQHNQGAAAARNLGVENANGEWIAFLDSDDIWDSEKIDIQFKSLGERLWSHTDSYFYGIGQTGSVKCSDLSPKKAVGHALMDLLIENTIGTSTILMKKSVFLESGGFDTEMKALQDWELWLRIADKYPISYVDKALVKYRVHQASTTRNYRKTMPYHLQLLDKVFGGGGVGAPYKNLKSNAYAQSFEIVSYVAEERADFGYSLWFSLNSLRHDPFSYKRCRRVLSVCLSWINSLILKK